MKRTMLLVVGLIALVTLALAVAACGTSSSPAASDAFAYAAQQGGNGGVFMLVKNPTKKDDALVSAKSSVSDKVELHTMVMAPGGGMMMQQVPNIPIPAGGQVELKKGSLHIMLFNLNKPLNVDDKFTVTLTTQNGSEITVPVTVKAQN